MIRTAAAATAADVIDIIRPSWGDTARCAGEASRSRITPTFSPLEARERTFGDRVRPHVELRYVEAAQRQDRADLRAMVAPVVRKLRERYPEVELGLAPLVADPTIEIVFLRFEKLLDRVVNAIESGGGLVERRGVGHLEEGLPDQTVRVEVALVREDDVREGFLDRAVRSLRRELQLLLRERAAALKQFLRCPDVVAHLAEHRWRAHVADITLFLRRGAPRRAAIRPRAQRRRLDAVRTEDGRHLGAVLVAVVHGLSDNDADRRAAALVQLDDARHVVSGRDVEKQRAGGRRDFRELVERV